MSDTMSVDRADVGLPKSAVAPNFHYSHGLFASLYIDGDTMRYRRRRQALPMSPQHHCAKSDYLRNRMPAHGNGEESEG